MCKGICGADCAACGFFTSSVCKGCSASCAAPFGKKCGIAERIGNGTYASHVKALLREINALGIPGMPEATQLFPLVGVYVNLAYPLPSGVSGKLLDDKEIYLGTQLEADGSDRCYGVVAGEDFLLIARYGCGGSEPELLLFKKREL